MARFVIAKIPLSPAARLGIGLVLPVLAVIPTVPLLGRLALSWHGLPFAVWWLFGCIPFASLCLGIVWLLHDRHQPDECVDSDYGAGGSP